ncbi:hypothetical protein DACRYDRAFT_13299 [Dacryopinax primogenitus]|uniref:Uncharacterized protein n=1 Tax=Dacryopinax primogenitus (strain DJM 731) TaxID=1858805 RepID=M5G907_DACPD|nr:uncharacterized protein DACRYDRAFT_13299 [Dacryopinax primogenitus]EJU05199.1 hypothetical protein DACRYDRAFT_13299 [Dacryopinax primogenitus]
MDREDMPRIGVDTFDDLERIKAGFTRQMLALLDEKLSSSSLGGEGEAIRAHLMAWRDRTFEIAKPNLRVNGINYEDHTKEADETEPFDEALDRQIWANHDEKLIWDKTLADSRRVKPVQIQKLVEDLLVRQRVEEEILDQDEEDMEADLTLPDVGEMEKAHRETLAYFGDFQKKVPELLEKVSNITRVEEDMQRLEQ